MVTSLKIISRKEAFKLSLKRYFTGKPCKYGHTHERYTKGGECCICRKNRTDKKRKEHPEVSRDACKKYYYKDHKKSLERLKKRREKRKEKGRIECRMWYLKNKARRLKTLHEQRKANPTYYRRLAKLWRDKNPERIKARTQRRRALEIGAEGFFTAQDVQNLRVAQKGLCALCAKPLLKVFHVDHIVPLSRGGTNDPNNIQLTHPRCNLSKGAKLPHEFLTHQRHLGEVP